MTDKRARKVARLLVELDELTTKRGRCVECGEENDMGCGVDRRCWLQQMYGHIPVHMLRLMTEVSRG